LNSLIRGSVEHSARLALLRADPGGAADAFVQWKDALYALQEAGGLTTTRKQGGVGPVDLLWERGFWGATHQVLS
jgi:hypothetical protein